MGVAMLDQILAQMFAVVVGGLLAIAGGFITPLFVRDKGT